MSTASAKQLAQALEARKAALAENARRADARRAKQGSDSDNEKAAKAAESLRATKSKGSSEGDSEGGRGRAEPAADPGGEPFRRGKEQWPTVHPLRHHPISLGADHGVSDLSPAQRRVLRAFFDPAMFGKPPKKVAEAAGCSVQVVYQARKDPAFQAAIRSILADALGPMLPALMDAAYRSALILGKEGHADRWKLLELAGVYQPRKAEPAGGGSKHLHLHGVGDRLSQALSHREAGSRPVNGHTSDTGPTLDADNLAFADG